MRKTAIAWTRDDAGNSFNQRGPAALPFHPRGGTVFMAGELRVFGVERQLVRFQLRDQAIGALIHFLIADVSPSRR
jgi:hypothetical protein